MDMDACQILLGHPWKFNVDTLHKGKHNFYVFSWKGKKIALFVSNIPEQNRSKVVEKQKVLLNVSSKFFKREIKSNSIIIALIVKDYH